MMNPATPTRRFYVTLAVLAVAGAVPLSLPEVISPTQWLSAPVRNLAVPVSEPLNRIGEKVRPTDVAWGADHPERLRLVEELERARTLAANFEARAAALAEQLERLNALYAIDPESRYLPVEARRAGSSASGRSQIFSVNVGSSDGVEIGVLALHQGYQLVGRVTDVSALTASVTPITQPGAGPIDVYLLPEEGTVALAAKATLEPGTGDRGEGELGTLVGRVGKDEPVEVGHRAIYRDETWAQIHTGPLVGIVEKIEPIDDAPLWNRIVVRPVVTLDRVATVELKVPRPRDGRERGGEPRSDSEGGG